MKWVIKVGDNTYLRHEEDDCLVIYQDRDWAIKSCFENETVERFDNSKNYGETQ